MKRWFELALVTASLVVGPHASACEKWAPSVEIGKLDPKAIDESSGLAVSRKYDALYHNNDSGSGPEFWVTARDGSNAKSVKIKGYVPKDPEEIALGPCPGASEKSCIVLADTGDNSGRRKNVAIFFIEELEKFPAEVEPFAVARFRYPDGSHDAEAVAVLPGGELVVVTKEGRLLKPTLPAGVYRAKAAEVLRAIKGEEIEFTKTGKIDVPTLMKDKGAGSLVTAMSVTSDGKRFTLLTYVNAIEIDQDLSVDSIPVDLGAVSRVVGITMLQGQESLSYDRNDKDILYSTEQVPQIFGKTHEVPLMKASCLK